MGKINISIDPRVLENVKKVTNSASTKDGILMLGLEDNHKYNFAGNTYLDALREIHFLMKQLGIENQLSE